MDKEKEETIDPYDALGGAAGIEALVDAFYERVQHHEQLIPLFAGSDFVEVKRKQALFLTQFLGGPADYSAEFGHPMLRYRHLPFAITPDRARAWLTCMREAMDHVGMQGLARDYFYGRLIQVAQHMVNSAEGSAE